MAVCAAEKIRPYCFLLDAPWYNHTGYHHGLLKFFSKLMWQHLTDKNTQSKIISWKKLREKTLCVTVEWNEYGLWLNALVWQNFAHCGSAPSNSGKQNVSNWSAKQSIHQRVHWDEEINVSALPRLFHLCQQALIQAWEAISWTYPKGIAHTQYWYWKGCLGAKKRPL